MYAGKGIGVSMRKYDADLVARIRDKEYVETIDGVGILMKPVPDDDRRHVMDPRILEIAKAKKAMFAQRAKGGFRLSNERYRPDKITYDLTKTAIDVEERLIDIRGDHKIDVYLYRRSDVNDVTPVLVYFHGGGFTAGDMRLFANQMKLIAELSSALVVFPEYRLAPECPFPGAIDDAKGTIDWVLAHAQELRIDPNRLMVAGDSAGASLTNACLLLDEAKAVKKAVELYPAADMEDFRTQTRYTWSYDAYEIIEEQKAYAYSRIDRIKNSVGGSEEDNLYLQGKTTFRDPLVSIIHATEEQLCQFPPMVIIASEYDYLRVGSDYFVKLLQKVGVDVRSIRYCGCDHGILDMLGTVVQAEELCHVLAEELQSV